MVKKYFLLFFLSRSAFLLFAILATYFIPLSEGYLGKEVVQNAPYLAWIWANFDGTHFLNIVKLGYKDFDYAFFPLYPLVIKIINLITLIEPLYIGIIISLVSFFLAMVMIYKIVRIDFNERTSNTALLLVSFFPLSFFYQSVYSDSLFLLLSVACFYSVRKGNWLLGGVLGGLTCLTRLAGLALLPALLVEWILQNKETFKEWNTILKLTWEKCFNALCLTLLGFLGYLLYLQYAYGDFLLFQKTMVAWQQQHFVFPPQVIFRYLKIFMYVDKTQLVFWVAFLEFFSVISYFALSFYVLKKVRLSYGIFMIVLLTLVTFTGTFAGTPRYMLHLFPGFIGMALILQKRTKSKMIVVGIFLILGFLLTGLFTRGYFVA